MLKVLLLVAALGQLPGPPDPGQAFGPKAAAPQPAKPALQNQQPAGVLDAWPAPPTTVFIKPVLPLIRPAKHTAKITDAPVVVNDLYVKAKAALLDKDVVPSSRKYEARFLSQWPIQDSDTEDLDRALRFWCSSLSRPREFVPPTRVPGLGWVLFLSDYGWSHHAWEVLTAHNPYFVVTTVDHHGKVSRGWVDPVLELEVRDMTYATRAIERADRFLGLTSLEVGDNRGGCYSLFMGLPATEPELLKQLGIDEHFLVKNSLLRGGAVLGGESIVAMHNRELQLFPSPFGLDERFLWRSLDTASDIKDQSVIKNFQGTIRIDGGEHIWTLKNGNHGYYIINAQRQRVAEVPTAIAQDKDDPHDVVVRVPYKCVKCHGPKGGIRHFDDVVKRMALNPSVALSVIQKYPGTPPSNVTQKALEDYYLSDLAYDITKQQESYTRVIRNITGLSPAANTENYLKFVNRYLFGLVDRQVAAYELAVEPEQLDAYLKQTGNDELMAILASEAIPRALFEQGFADGMRARIHPWERSPTHVKPQVAAPAAAPPPAQPAAAPPQAKPVHHAPAHPQQHFNSGGRWGRRR